MCNGARVERNRYYPYKSMKVVWDLMPSHRREETPTASRLCDPCFERHKKRRQRWAKTKTKAKVWNLGAILTAMRNAEGDREAVLEILKKIGARPGLFNAIVRARIRP